MNPSNDHPLSDSQTARRQEDLDLRMAILASQNDQNVDRRMDSINAELASQNELNQEGLLRARSRALSALNTPLPRLPDYEPFTVEQLTRPFDGSGTSFVFDRTGQASQAEFRTREAPARTRDILLSRSPEAHTRTRDALLSRSPEAQARTRDALHRREARIIPASAGEARIIPDSAREARTSYVLSGQASQAEFQAQNRLRDARLREEAPVPASAREAHTIPDSAREARTIPARVSNPWPNLAEPQSGVPLREGHFRSLSRLRRLARGMETREREATRTEDHRRDTRTFHISIPNSELASQNQTMNLSSQQAGPAGNFRVSVPRVREAFRRDTNAPDVDQFNTILTQLAERDLQNV